MTSEVSDGDMSALIRTIISLSFVDLLMFMGNAYEGKHALWRSKIIASSCYPIYKGRLQAIKCQLNKCLLLQVYSLIQCHSTAMFWGLILHYSRLAHSTKQHCITAPCNGVSRRNVSPIGGTAKWDNPNTNMCQWLFTTHATQTLTHNYNTYRITLIHNLII